MSAVDFQPILNTLYQYHGDFFDQEAPNDLICTISNDLIVQPLAVNCRSGHVFEKEDINRWLTGKKICPIDEDPITTTFRNRSFETYSRNWFEHHFIQPIEPEHLAYYLLFDAPAIDTTNCVRTGAYLRFIRIAGLTQEVVTNMIKLLPKEDEEKSQNFLSELHRLVQLRAFRGEEPVLQDIIRDVSSEISSKLSPEATRIVQTLKAHSDERDEHVMQQVQECLAASDQRTREYMQTFLQDSERRVMESLDRRMMEVLQKLRDAEIHSKEELDRITATLQQLIDRMDGQDNEVSELKTNMLQIQGRLQDEIGRVMRAVGEQASNYGPLSSLEQFKLAISVVGPITLCALARGCAAYMDDDPNTRFVQEFLNFNILGVIAGTWQFLKICYSGWVEGNPALHRLSERVTPDQLMLTVITAILQYHESLTNANHHWANFQNEQAIDALNLEMNSQGTTCIDRIEQLEDKFNLRINQMETKVTELSNTPWWKMRWCSVQ